MTLQEKIQKCVIELGLLIQIGIGGINLIIMSYVGNFYQNYQNRKLNYKRIKL